MKRKNVNRFDCIEFLKNHGVNKYFARMLVQSAWRDIADIMSGDFELDCVSFDDYLHSKYGDYEDEGKTERDMFHIVFKEDYNKACEYFGLEEYRDVK